MNRENNENRESFRDASLLLVEMQSADLHLPQAGIARSATQVGFCSSL